MKTIHFAIASIFYHKKAMVLYTLVSFFAVIGLIVTFALIYSMDQVIAQTRDLLTTEDLQTKVAEEIQPVTTIYHQLFYLIFSAFTLVFIGFQVYYQLSKRSEYTAWLASGATTRQWVAMQLLEMLLPLLAAAVTAFVLLLLFQPYFQRELLSGHIIALDRERASDHFWEAVQSLPGQEFAITIPQNNQILVQNVDLNSTTWLAILFESTRHTLIVLLAAVTSFTGLIASGHSLYWRKKQWKNQLS
ncbi:hypothetical protein IGI96_000443 [Enterococcus sp. DIV0421]|uniref:hypothetical protein n=1 Tax=Enterococcus sp. DIV0421 TaxID=2774688 RepID=UPI003F2360A7